MEKFFYRPQDGYLADCMPLYHEGVFYIFYLKDYHDKEQYPEGVSWNLVCTKDFLHFEDKGEVLKHHGKNDQDLYAYTGCVIEKENMFHMFYVSHNPYFPEQGRPRQGICHAISTDLLHWKRCPEDDFFSPGDGYEINDWRDPLVFWNEEEKRYWMLFAAKKVSGPPKGRGVTALATSTDLAHWELGDPVFDSGRYIVPECPEIFRMGEWWYLLFSEFSDEFMTRYRMAKSPYGPWIEPEKDTFDGRSFYAAKTCAGEGGRYLMGWNPTRRGDTDFGDWEWGGSLVVHRLFQRPDGTLGVGPVRALVESFTKDIEINIQESCFGSVRRAEQDFTVDGEAVLSTVSLGNMPKAGMISLDYEVRKNRGGFGLWLHGTKDFEEGYYFRIEPYKQRVVMDMWPRDQVSDPLQIAGRDTNPYRPGLYQMISPEVCEKGHMDLIFDGSVGILYLTDGSALDVRMYSLKGDNWGIFARNTEVLFSNVRLRTTEDLG